MRKLSKKRIREIKEEGYGDKGTEEQLRRIMEQESEEENRIIEMTRRKQKTEGIIEKMREPYRVILYLKYINMNTMEEIGKKLSYSTIRIYQLHKEGLEEFCKRYEEEEKGKE